MQESNELGTIRPRLLTHKKIPKLNQERRSLNVGTLSYIPKQPIWAERYTINSKKCSYTDLNKYDKRGSMSTVATLSTDFLVQDDDTIEEISSNENIDNTKFKTELCKNWSLHGKCNYGNKCQFAHGQQEIMSKSSNTKYKSKFCRSFHQDYVCYYGARCQFIHESRSVDQIRQDYSSNTIFYQPNNYFNRLNSFKHITQNWLGQQLSLKECIKQWQTKLLIQINLESSSD